MIRRWRTQPKRESTIAWRRVLARPASGTEKQVMSDALHRFESAIRPTLKPLAEFLTSGDSSRTKSLDPRNSRPTPTVASLILNLDETITKE